MGIMLFIFKKNRVAGHHCNFSYSKGALGKIVIRRSVRRKKFRETSSSQ
jgi:hypothetical protein